MIQESDIIVNEQSLTPSEVMTIRVALTLFRIDLENYSPGDGEDGIKMKEDHIKNIQEIFRKIRTDIV